MTTPNPNLSATHAALIERLEAVGRMHRAREAGLRKRLASGDPTVSAQDPGNAARSAETQEQAAQAIRELEAKVAGLEAAAIAVIDRKIVHYEGKRAKYAADPEMFDEEQRADYAKTAMEFLRSDMQAALQTNEGKIE